MHNILPCSHYLFLGVVMVLRLIKAPLKMTLEFQELQSLKNPAADRFIYHKMCIYIYICDLACKKGVTRHVRVLW